MSTWPHLQRVSLSFLLFYVYLHTYLLAYFVLKGKKDRLKSISKQSRNSDTLKGVVCFQTWSETKAEIALQVQTYWSIPLELTCVLEILELPLDLFPGQTHSMRLKGRLLLRRRRRRRRPRKVRVNCKEPLHSWPLKYCVGRCVVLVVTFGP